MQGIDLHTHSNISDGTLSPELLVQAAVDVKLHTLALTDHDTMDGLQRARNAAQPHDLQIISGVDFKPVVTTKHEKKLWRTYCGFKYAR